ncbi:MAG TPA: DNA methyltransferase [Sphingomonas sp.]|nr:DNA methyltransferase [Sphingomonas sp.]
MTEGMGHPHLEGSGIPRDPQIDSVGLFATTAPTRQLNLSAANQMKLVSAARSKAQVTGLTHTLYRYPARFSPGVARAAIELFTEPGDIVADCFVGGGTSLVEALALGRDAIGTDISTLAAFISQVKTTLIDEDRLASIGRWAEQVVAAINMRDEAPKFEPWEDAGYLRHLDHRDRWRIRKALSQAVGWLPKGDEQTEKLARCIILRTAQWALDGRRTIPTIDEFKIHLTASAAVAIAGLRELARNAGETPSRVEVLNRSAVGFDEDAAFGAFLAERRPRLILTSPPYPGVHVLYHRWQVDGRKETRAPFWIANTLDGSGASYYTMGDRKQPDLPVYFETLAAAQRSIAGAADADTTIVQIVAFTRPDEQLPRYNAAAVAAGLEEYRLEMLQGEADGRLWREVPNRKWYNGQRAATSASNEVLLFYRLAR